MHKNDISQSDITTGMQSQKKKENDMRRFNDIVKNPMHTREEVLGVTADLVFTVLGKSPMVKSLR